jgi:hypothetical protein
LKIDDGQVVQMNIWLTAADVGSGLLGGPKIVQFPPGYICRSVKASSGLADITVISGTVFFIVENTATGDREIWGFGSNNRLQLLLPLSVEFVRDPVKMTWLSGDILGAGVNMKATNIAPRAPMRRRGGSTLADMRTMLNSTSPRGSSVKTRFSYW